MHPKFLTSTQYRPSSEYTQRNSEPKNSFFVNPLQKNGQQGITEEQIYSTNHQSFLPEEITKVISFKQQFLKLIDGFFERERGSLTQVIDEFLKKILEQTENLKQDIQQQLQKKRNQYQELFNNFLQNVQNFNENSFSKLQKIQFKYGEQNTDYIQEYFNPIQRELSQVNKNKKMIQEKEIFFKSLEQEYQSSDIVQQKKQIEEIMNNQNLEEGYDKENLLNFLKNLYLNIQDNLKEIQKQVKITNPQHTTQHNPSLKTSFMDLNLSHQKNQRTSIFTTNNSGKLSSNNLLNVLKTRLDQQSNDTSKNKSLISKYRFDKSPISPTQTIQQDTKQNLLRKHQLILKPQLIPTSPIQRQINKNPLLLKQIQKSPLRSLQVVKKESIIEGSSLATQYNFEFSKVILEKQFLSKQYITCYEVLFENNQLLAGTQDGQLLFFDLGQQQKFITLNQVVEMHNIINFIIKLKTNQIIISLGNDIQKKLILYDVFNKKQLKDYLLQHQVTQIKNIDNDHFIVTCQNDKLYIFNSNKSACLKNYNLTKQGITDFVIISPNTVCIGTKLNEINIFQFDSQYKFCQIGTSKIEGNINYFQKFIKNEKVILINCSNKSQDELLLYNVQQRTIVQRIEIGNPILFSLIYTSIKDEKINLLIFNEQNRVIQKDISFQKLIILDVSEGSVSLSKNKYNQQIRFFQSEKKFCSFFLLKNGNLVIFTFIKQLQLRNQFIKKQN